ncbi:MAG: DUF2914 domain-containing protein [Desulfobacterales bacterium]|nr:DUF2914 domain-containing protein [Desulfobacterales bacterium]
MKRFFACFRGQGVLLLTAFVLFFSFPALVCAGELRLTRALACLDIKDREPVGESSTFPPSTQRVFCFTDVEAASGPSEIRHVWYFSGKKVHEFSVPVKPSRWRTWTSKNIFPAQTGPWRVDVVETSSQKVIGSVQFVVK